MTAPLLGDKVDVGGCVGNIHAMTDDTVEVSGTYYYVEGGVDHWSFLYKRDRFEKAIWNEATEEWDATKVRTINGDG